MTVKSEPNERVGAELRRCLVEAAAGAFGLAATELPPVELAAPRERGHGDLAANLAMQLARRLRRAPRQIALELAAALETDPARIARVEVAGPGFINFHLAVPWVQAQVRSMLAAGAGFGRSAAGGGRAIQVEFVSANPTGPLNVVSARAAAVGDTLVRLLRAAGYAAQAEFYVNDAGTQVELLGASLEARWRQTQGEDVAVPEGGYHGAYVGELAAAIAAEPGCAALEGAALRERFRSRGLERLLAAQRAGLERFGVRFDRWFRESELHAAGALDAARGRLAAAGGTAERQGALWFRSSQHGDDADRVIVRSDGRPTYLLADIAYHADKQARGFERVIDIWGPDHHGHVARMQAAVAALGLPRDWLEVLIVQQVNLLRGGQPVKMSKRSGELIVLDELLDEVGRDPARFFFLMRRVEAHLDFDLELAKQQNDENPCFYVQYAHARLASVLAHAAARGLESAELEAAEVGRLEAEVELELIKRLLALPEVVRASAERREPHRMTVYLREVAALCHRFYHQQRVVGVEPGLSHARLALVRATQIVLENGLELIGIDAPEHM